MANARREKEYRGRRPQGPGMGPARHLNGSAKPVPRLPCLSARWQARRPNPATMEPVLHILTVTFPFFALVLCGYLAARRGMLPLAAIPGLNGFVLFFALPCMLYRFGASTPIAQLLDVHVALTYLVCALVMVGFVVAVTLHGRIGWNDAAFGALVGAFPNTGFMGVPLLVALLGAKAAGPAIVTILVDMVFTSSLCIALSRLGQNTAAGGVSATQAAKNALKGVAANPMPWSLVVPAASARVLPRRSRRRSSACGEVTASASTARPPVRVCRWTVCAPARMTRSSSMRPARSISW